MPLPQDRVCLASVFLDRASAANLTAAIIEGLDSFLLSKSVNFRC